jgi:hypothetical protein
VRAGAAPLPDAGWERFEVKFLAQQAERNLDYFALPLFFHKNQRVP